MKLCSLRTLQSVWHSMITNSMSQERIIRRKDEIKKWLKVFIVIVIQVITNYVSNYIHLLVRIAHIICNHPIFSKQGWRHQKKSLSHKRQPNFLRERRCWSSLECMKSLISAPLPTKTVTRLLPIRPGHDGPLTDVSGCPADRLTGETGNDVIRRNRKLTLSLGAWDIIVIVGMHEVRYENV